MGAMSVNLKTPQEIEMMRIAGRLASEVLDIVTPHVKPGVTTEELDRICHDHIVNLQGAIPANVGYRGFPKTVCTSVNNVICHGIPSEGKVLKDGDIINIDVTVIKDGWHGDTSRMYFVGTPSVMARRLVETTYEAMWRGIRAVRPGATLGDIGHAIQSYAEGERFSVVREYCGHGIGKVYHDEPQVVHYGRPGQGLVLQPGMTFTIEPMINEGTRYNKVLPDGWTVVTKDRKLSAQWEHMVAVTETGVDVLTLSPGESQVS